LAKAERLFSVTRLTNYFNVDGCIQQVADTVTGDWMVIS
jgi:hypothetical protein